LTAFLDAPIDGNGPVQYSEHPVVNQPVNLLPGGYYGFSIGN
jgi:hypothetical protein